MGKSISITDLYELLSVKIGKTEASTLVNFIEDKITEEVIISTKHLATKEDVEKGFKEQTRWMLTIFITLVIMILGLYAAIIFKK